MYLGIDTSNYTTSAALFDDQEKIIYDGRIPLPVAKGEKGLQQSTALFHHVKNLPVLMAELGEIKGSPGFKAIAVSARPRPLEDSYMPVFMAGVSWAKSLSSLLNIPLFMTSHQEGHLAAGLWSAGMWYLKEFLAVHLSGGTTELLRVSKTENKAQQFSIDILGGSGDIQAGQFIDRIGVALGLPFPAGPHLEKLAAQVGVNPLSREDVIPSSVKGYEISFSGAETRARQLLKQGREPYVVARAVESCIAATLENICKGAIKETGIKKVLIVGGVGANNFIRQYLTANLQHWAIGAELFFPEAKYSSDNAVGVSFIAKSTV